MTVIRVVPESVTGYGNRAQSTFGEMHTSLKTLVDECVEVRYFGPNAVAFKTEAGRLAADFANKLHADIAGMAGAVRASTSNIAGSLGGSPISITVDARPIVPATPESVDYVDVDTSALEALTPRVTSHFESLRTSLDNHLEALRATDWEGNAKISAVEQVQAYTVSARSKCDAAQQSITRYITEQLNSVVTADK
jgi:hypothetical protein